MCTYYISFSTSSSTRTSLKHTVCSLQLLRRNICQNKVANIVWLFFSTVLEAVINMGAIFDHPACLCYFSLLLANTISTDSLLHWQATILISSGWKLSMIIEENNQNKQGGRKLKTVDYCLHYGILRKQIRWNNHRMDLIQSVLMLKLRPTSDIITQNGVQGN